MTLPHVTENDLDHGRDGDGQQGAQEAGQLDGDQDRDQNRQRVELDGAGEDERTIRNDSTKIVIVAAMPVAAVLRNPSAGAPRLLTNGCRPPPA